MDDSREEVVRLKPVRLEGVPAYGVFPVVVRRDSVYSVRERLDLLPPGGGVGKGRGWPALYAIVIA